MKRGPKVITETCPCCGRPDWNHQVSYQLWTPEERTGWEGDSEAYERQEAANAGIILDDSVMLCVAMGGSRIDAAIKEAMELARQTGKIVAFVFNGRAVRVTAESDPSALYRQWYVDLYGETPEEAYAKR